MGIDRSKRITFEQVADLYDEITGSYPDIFIEDIIRLSGIPPQGRILEIGPGPGNATLQFARRGYRILGIELGERLAELARQNCHNYPDVSILNMAFEDWQVEENAFDLAFSVDAFHWIVPEIGYPKVARALKEGGSAAFAWRVPVDPQTDWSKELDELYRESTTQFDNPNLSFSAEWLVDLITGILRDSGCFDEPLVRLYRWEEILTADRYIKALRTYSVHQGIDELVRERLYQQIYEVIQQVGGQVNEPQSVALFLAKMR